MSCILFELNHCIVGKCVIINQNYLDAAYARAILEHVAVHFRNKWLEITKYITDMEKEKLIKAIQQKGLSNSLILLYYNYNIGRALPFRAQRFPDGRVSSWYFFSMLRFMR